MNKLDQQYKNLLQDILDNGIKKEDRTGTGTLSVFGRQIRHKMSDGFPLLTSKKMAWKPMVIELLWFLKGDTNIKWLLENGCFIWVGDAYKNYLNRVEISSDPYDRNILSTEPMVKDGGEIEGWSSFKIGEPFSRDEFIEKIKTDERFCKKWGDLGPIYGAQWRRWNTNKTIVIEHNGMNNEWGTVIIDQISNLISDLKKNPDSRRLIVSAWNAGEIENMKLPPCHYGFQCYTRELSIEERKDIYFKLHPDWAMISTHHFFDGHNIPKRSMSLMFNMRSVDFPLGLPFNLASYGLLLHLLCKEVNMLPDELIFSGGDCHIYLNQVEGINKQLKNETYPLPSVEISSKPLFDISYSDIKLINYQSADKVDLPLSN